MKMNRNLLLSFLLSSAGLSAQVKIGDNPQTINPGSLLELESTDRALVITRVSDAQMNALNASTGAIVYNTDFSCLYYYNGAEWINICESLPIEFATEAIVNTAPTIVITQNGDVVNFEVSEIRSENILDFTIGSQDIQNNSINSDKLATNSVGTDELQDNTITDAEIDYSQVTVSDFNNDAGYLTTGELISGDPGNDLTAGSDGGAYFDAEALEVLIFDNADGVAANAAAIAADGDTDDTNELQDLTLSDNTLSIANGNSVDLSVFNDPGSDDQQLTGLNLDPANNLTITLEDGGVQTVNLSSLDNPGTDNQTLGLDGNDLTITGGNTVDLSGLTSGVNTDEQTLAFDGVNLDILNGNSISLATLEESADISANATLITDHITNDEDLSATNEIEIPGGGNPGQVLSTDGTGIYNWVDAAGVDTDNQTVDQFFIDGSDQLLLSLEDDGTVPVSVNLSPYEESADILANTTLISNHIAADEDLSITNEIELPIGGNNGDILSTDGAGNYAWIPFTGGGTDDQAVDLFEIDVSNQLNLSLQDDGAVPYTVDLSPFEESADIAANTTLINNHIAADLDLDDTNEIELPTGGVAGQFLETDGAGNYSWADGANTDDQTVDLFNIDGSNLLNLSLEDDGAVPYTVDLSPFEESADIAANTTLINNHIAADLDLDDTNEIELPTGGVTGQFLETDGAGNYSWADGANTDDQTVDLFNIDGSNLLNLSLEDDGAVPYTVDLSPFEESADIATNTTLINNHIAADLDLDDTNEIELPTGGVAGQFLETDGAGN
ncbi:hypothetical protein H7F20_06860, partial [Robiginitalea sp. SC105]|nr:hypothetical protein [Robiginitalea sp. SC105]